MLANNKYFIDSSIFKKIVKDNGYTFVKVERELNMSEHEISNRLYRKDYWYGYELINFGKLFNVNPMLLLKTDSKSKQCMNYILANLNKHESSDLHNLATEIVKELKRRGH